MKKVLLLTLLNCLVFNDTALFAQSKTDSRKNLNPNLYPFYHGVASGDPLSDRVILWTRITDENLIDSTLVEWRIATDTLMTNIVLNGSGYAKAENDWTFKTDAIGLQSNTWYYYDFKGLGKYSIRGRTKTAPTANVSQVRMGVVSCSDYENGYFEAYKYLKERNDLDVVLHLGDYIYEYATEGNTIGREEVLPANEIVTLEDYRLRYSHYRLDQDLMRLHQQYPFITVWDDHESANNSWMNGAENHSPATEGEWALRKNNSGKAYHEWLPIRSPQPSSYSIYRKIQYGNLFDLLMLDTRIEGRSEQGGNTNDPSRSLLGTEQFAWLSNELQNSTAQWKILGQQVMMAPLQVFGSVLNNDQWDGYNYERQQLYSLIQNNAINNVIVLTGDIHTSWVNDLPISGYNASNCSGSVGVEYVVTSVTSSGLGALGGIGGGTISLFNPHNKYNNLSKHGYLLLDVTPSKVTGNFYYMNDLNSSGNGEYFESAWYCNTGEKCANQASSASSGVDYNTPFAPEFPIDYVAYTNNLEPIIGFSAYPNPTMDETVLQLYSLNSEKVDVFVIDANGKHVIKEKGVQLTQGLNYIQFNLQDFKNGDYYVRVLSKNGLITKRIVKF
jgi:alkaline phosphatase D